MSSLAEYESARLQQPPSEINMVKRALGHKENSALQYDR